ncbi:Protein KRTCAP2 -like protein [Toxocara canis]|uniref:Protein KRTCAP2-like protein n=2 Tax=Toxocara canis TaxID=6265 RepID=A0A0B2UT18_TOXCA|nr:Protein KRTCAP2 -like protein [Toxocara canis]VDM38774.1 unnamed protein product [Toxocara canis]
MTNHTTSTILSFLAVLLLLAGIQVMKTELAASRAGTLVGGVLCSVLFVFILTAVSNMQMSSAGEGAKAGLFEVIICLMLAVITAASVHRVTATVCVLLCVFLVFILSSIAQTRYNTPVAQQSITLKKKK